MRILCWPLIILLATEASAAAPAEALLFRKIFAQKAAAQYSREEIHKLIFLPNEALLNHNLQGQATVQDVLAAHRLKLQTLLPSQLYKQAASIPDPETGWTVKHPVTIVILPGIFGEFIDHIPYEEILQNQESTFARTWTAAATDDLTDPVFDLESLQTVDQPLRNVVVAGSLDDATGAAAVRILLLKAPNGSLESLGTLAGSAAVYQRRLTKIFSRLGNPEHAYFMGYSRGLNVGMELLSTSDPADYPWLRGFQGLISLGGVTYGSAVADNALDPKSAQGEILGSLQRLANELEVPTQADIALFLRNAHRWSQTVLSIGNALNRLPTYEGLQMENIKTEKLDPGFMVRTFKDIALNKFQLDRPFADYASNVLRFKWFVRESIEGIKTLTTENCLEWLKTHQLPDSLHYYAITTVMPDPSSAETGISPLTGNSLAFDASSIDYRVLRTGYYSYVEASGMKLNDSQISLDRSPFWPELHQLANPQQKPFLATLLAVLGTDHWGMSFPVAFETRPGKVNPFPRTLLMESLGAYLGSQD